MKLSVIIPTCNESQYLHKTINTLINHAEARQHLEIIVVDCGSSDGTVTTIKHKSVVIVENAQLRGKKWKSLNLGGRLAQGEILLFLDADTQVPPNFDTSIRQALEDEHVIGGAFEFDFDDSSFLLNLIIFVNRLRYRWRKSYYGDQGIFVRNSVFKEVKGWPNRNLLEGAYFCKELKKHGKLVLLRQSVKTSARRFQQNGVGKMLIKDLKIWLMNLIGRDVEKFAADYWAENQQAVYSRGKAGLKSSTIA